MKKGDIVSKVYEVEGEAPITLEAKVNWIVGDECGLLYTAPADYKGSCGTESTEGWKVILEATPTYQSSVAKMSDDELRASIETLRASRITAPKPSRRKPRSAPVANNPLAKLIAGLSKEDKAKLRKKMGMTE